MTSRFILRYRGTGEIPQTDLNRVKAAKGVRVVEQTARMLLVEGDEGSVNGIASGMERWVLAFDRSVPVPDSRPRIRNT
jgi:hypothetical protein